jgi:hypothetical protein
MSTVHLEPSRKWLPAIEENIAALEKLADEWHAKEKALVEEYKKVDNEACDKRKERLAEYLRQLKEYKALPWLARRFRAPPLYPYETGLRYWHTMRPYPMAPMIAALHSLVAPALRNLPLDVDAEIAALFIK